MANESKTGSGGKAQIDPRDVKRDKGPITDKDLSKMGRASQTAQAAASAKEPEITMLKVIEGRQHPDSIKLKKMKKKTNKDGNIEFVELKAKGGRAGYSVGGKAIRGVSKILLKK